MGTRRWSRIVRFTGLGCLSYRGNHSFVTGPVLFLCVHCFYEVPSVREQEEEEEGSDHEIRLIVVIVDRFSLFPPPPSPHSRSQDLGYCWISSTNDFLTIHRRSR